MRRPIDFQSAIAHWLWSGFGSGSVSGVGTISSAQRCMSSIRKLLREHQLDLYIHSPTAIDGKCFLLAKAYGKLHRGLIYTLQESPMQCPLSNITKRRSPPSISTASNSRHRNHTSSSLSSPSSSPSSPLPLAKLSRVVNLLLLRPSMELADRQRLAARSGMA
jgi:hypothetical protein